jgi:hypothetical protein
MANDRSPLTSLEREIAPVGQSSSAQSPIYPLMVRGAHGVWLTSDVRGTGVFFALDLVTDRNAKEPLVPTTRAPQP